VGGGRLKLPLLVRYETEGEYRVHYESVYCRKPIMTFDGIEVRFRKNCFDHCFFESSNRDSNKDKFSWRRSERIDWIKAALKDPNAELFVGWDNRRKRHDHSRRVAVVVENYIVIISMKDNTKAQFITAFIADSDLSIKRIKQSPKWSDGKNK